MNMKRFITVAVVFALGWISFGIGSALLRVNQMVTSGRKKSYDFRESTQPRERSYFVVTCKCGCSKLKVTVEDLYFGKPLLYVAKRYLPRLDFYNKCHNCWCESRNNALSNRCQLSGLDIESIFIAVHPMNVLLSATLTVEADDIIGLKKFTVHSKDLGDLGIGDVRYFKVTCNGECIELTVFLKSDVGRHFLFLATDSRPKLDKKNDSCINCFCESKRRTWAGSCEISRLEKPSSSFWATVVPKYGSVKVIISVAGFNVTEFEEL